MKKVQEKSSLSEVEELEKLLLLSQNLEKVRVSFLLPKRLVLLMDELATGQSRNKVALRAILKEVKEKKKKEAKKKKAKLEKKLEESVRKRCKELASEYQARSKEDAKIAQDWFPLEEEAWETWQEKK